MYQQLPEFVRREAKAYWFITAAQAGAGIGLFVILAFADLIVLAPAGAVLGVVALTKRQGVHVYEKVLAQSRWLVLQVQEQDVLDQADLFRTTTPPVQATVLLRRPAGPTIAVSPGEKR